MLITYQKEITVEVDAETFEEACEKVLAMEQDLEFAIAFFEVPGENHVRITRAFA
jgi:hypothetical protein